MHTYSLPKWLKITLVIIGIPMVAAFLAIVAAPAFTDTFNKVYFLVGPPALGMAGLFTFALLQLNERLTINDHSIKYSSRFINRELLLTDIAGFRYSRNYLVLQPLPERGKRIQITRYMTRFGEIENWTIDRYSNLDKIEAAAVYDDRSLRDSKEAVVQKIRQAKQEVYTLNGVIIVLSLVPYIWPDYGFPAYCLLMACPLVSIFLLYRHKGLVKLGDNQDASPAMELPFLFGSFMLTMHALRLNILRYDKIWLPAIAIAVILGILLFAVRRRYFKKGTHYLAAGLLLLIFFGHGYGSIVLLDQMMDKGAPDFYKARIQKMWVSHGKNASYHLQLDPWGPQPKADDVTTSEDFYDSVQVNDTVAISLHQGGLDIPYFFVDYYLGKSGRNQ